ncbi:hypothetical protein P1T79_24655, partial [Escherichia coli]|nr:hypothetical protein [Escherichia coli]
LMMNPVPWLQMTNMISYQGLVRTFLKCATVNFHEANYNNIVIKKVDGENLDSGIYQVMNSVPLEEKERLYDPKKRLKLKHYIIAGYDSYVEILATGFSCIRCQAIDGVK